MPATWLHYFLWCVMDWQFVKDDGKWECFSKLHDNGDPFRWTIRVCQDGKFDVNESSAELCNGVAAFETLAAAKAFCESSENTHLQICPDQGSVVWLYEDELPENYDYDANFHRSQVRDGVRMFPQHVCDWQKSIDGGTEVCKCGAWR